MSLDDIWHEQDKKMFDKLQGLINRCKSQIRDIEAVELTDASFKRRESLNDTLSILQYCWDRSNTYIEALGTEHNWTIDKETELAQTKLELIRMKNNNSFLMKLCTKLDGKRIVKRPLYILHPRHIIKPLVNNF